MRSSVHDSRAKLFGHAMIAFLALGGRGDVEPLARVAHHVSAMGHLAPCVVITHTQLAPAVQCTPGVRLRPLPLQIIPSPEAGIAPAIPARVELDMILDACTGAAALAFTPSCVCGFIVAAKLCIPCVLVCPTPFFGSPSFDSVRRAAIRAHGRAAAAWLERSGTEADVEPLQQRVTAADVRLWMSPLLLPHYRQWACSRFGEGEAPWRSAGIVCPSVPVLVMTAPALFERPAWWPRSARLVGIAQPVPRLLALGASTALHEAILFLSQRLEDYGGAVTGSDSDGACSTPRPTPCRVLACFGSMVPLRIAPSEASLVALLDATLLLLEQQSRAVFVVNTFASGHGGSGVELHSPRVLVIRTPDLPLQDLLPHCAVSVHHAGAGSVAAAALSAIPQVACPCAMDQFEWGSIVEKVGLGVKTGPLPELRASELASAIDRARSPIIVSACVAAAQQLRAQDGAREVARVLMQAVTSPA